MDYRCETVEHDLSLALSHFGVVCLRKTVILHGILAFLCDFDAIYANETNFSLFFYTSRMRNVHIAAHFPHKICSVKTSF